MERFQTSNVSSNGNTEGFTAKIDVPEGYVMLYTIADADIGSLKCLHTLVFVPHACGILNKIVWSELNFLTKNCYHF